MKAAFSKVSISEKASSGGVCKIEISFSYIYFLNLFDSSSFNESGINKPLGFVLEIVLDILLNVVLAVVLSFTLVVD